MNLRLNTALASLTLFAAVAAPVASPAASTHRVFDGHVVHVSNANIKVQGIEGGKTQTLSFLIDHGTKLRHMLKPGEYVRVIFDQRFLGIRHADSIDPYGDPAMKMKS